MTNARIASDADVDPSAVIGEGSSVWGLAQVRERAEVGANCVVGRGAYIDVGVRMGRNCKIQNLALVYAPAELGDGVFIGPAVVLTNDRHPRAVEADGSLKSASDWDAAGVRVGNGAAIGARSVVVAGVEIGSWAMVGAGSVVVRNVPAFSLNVGNPARRIGWVGRSGVRLETDGPEWRCPKTGARYVEDGELLVEL